MTSSAVKPFSIGFVAALMIGVALTFTTLRLARPFANDRLKPGTDAITPNGVIVTPLDFGPEGLMSGDVVTAIEERPLSEWIRARSTYPWRPTQTVIYSIERTGESLDIPVTLGRYPLGIILRFEWGTFSYYFFYLLIGIFVFWQQPRQPAAQLLFLSSAAQFGALPWSLGLNASDVAYAPLLWLYHLGTSGAYLLTWIASFHFALTFPQPAPVLARRWFIPLLYGLPYAGLVAFLIVTGRQASNWLDWMGRWGSYSGVIASTFLAGTMLVILWQYRRSSGPTRQQVRWLVWGAAVASITAVIFSFLPRIMGFQPIDDNLLGLIGAVFPLSIAVAILRHNLFAIDVLLNRTLVYGALTTAVILVYAAVVGILSTLLQQQNNLFIALVGTGLVAVLFQPLRQRLQRGVDRLLYGRRDEPFEVLAALGQQLEGTLSPQMVYPTIVETVATSLRLPYAAIAVRRDGQAHIVYDYGKKVSEPVVFPLTHQGETVGEIHVGRRARNESFSEADERLLRNIARQAGAAVHTVRLMSDLQASRQKLITALEEERRRLRRDLHDGLGPHLASQTLTIDAIDKLMKKDPKHARKLLGNLKDQSQMAVQDIRRLVYGLRPPALDELGLVGALRESATNQSYNGLNIDVTAEEIPSGLPAAVEVAAFYIVQEGITNVARHAGATSCQIGLSVVEKKGSPTLWLTIIDNGRGLPSNYHTGVGLQSIRERTTALGGTWSLSQPPEGGCRLEALLPLSDLHKEDQL